MTIRTLLFFASLILVPALPEAHAQAALFFDAGIYGAAGDMADEDASLVTFGYRAVLPMTLGRTRLTHELAYNHADLNPGVHAATHDHGVSVLHGDEEHDGMLHSHTYLYRLSVEHALSERWTLSGAIAPAMQSRMKPSPDDFALTGSGWAFASRRMGSGATVGVGVAYSRIFGRPMLHPVVAASWDNDGTIAVNVLLPEHAEAWWTPHRSIGIGFALRTEGNAYRVGGLESAGVTGGQVGFTNTTAGPAVRAHIGRSLTIMAEGGQTVWRELRLPGAAADVVSDPDEASYLRIGLKVALR